AAIDRDFGSWAQFQEQFNTAATSLFGSGWTWLVLDAGKLKIVNLPNQDNPLSFGQTPLLALDIWEHAYYLKNQNRRVDYLAAWWQVVNWPEAARRFLEAK
ncbi:MAG: Fe-Mn family superoxide dismutase, partial [Patescibacteria group bacterium]